MWDFWVGVLAEGKEISLAETRRRKEEKGKKEEEEGRKEGRKGKRNKGDF